MEIDWFTLDCVQKKGFVHSPPPPFLPPHAYPSLTSYISLTPQVEHSEVDLRWINDAFFKIFKKTLETTIRGDTSGNYRKLLLRVLDRARITNPPQPAVTAAAAAIAAAPPPAPAAPEPVAAVGPAPVLTGQKTDQKKKVDHNAEAEPAPVSKGAHSMKAKGNGISITTASGTVVVNPGKDSDQVLYDYDGDGVPDVEVSAPHQTGRGKAATISLQMTGDTHF